MNNDIPVQELFRQIEQRLIARLDKMETTILAEFQSWDLKSAIRQSALLNSWEQRISRLEDQMAEVRDRLK